MRRASPPRGCTARRSSRSRRPSTTRREYPLPFELDLGLDRLPYDVPNIRAENGPAEANVRIGWFRAVTNNFHVFAFGSFADEMAHAAGRDPLEFLLDMLGPGKVLDLKAQGVEYCELRRAATTIPDRHAAPAPGARSRGARRRLGEASKRATAAAWASPRTAASTPTSPRWSRSRWTASGGFSVPRIEQVVDAGVIVNPDRVRSQMEGAAVMAVGLARNGEITAANGRIQQTNFHELPGGAHERRAVTGQRARSSRATRRRRAWASRACRR